MAAWGGFRYSPTTSRTLSMNCGSVDSLKVSTRCGLSPNARQIRLIADCDIPVARANDRVDQCVASVGVVSSVMTSTCSTGSSVIVRATPGRARRGSEWPATSDKVDSHPRAPSQSQGAGPGALRSGCGVETDAGLVGQVGDPLGP